VLSFQVYLTSYRLLAFALEVLPIVVLPVVLLAFMFDVLVLPIVVLPAVFIAGVEAGVMVFAGVVVTRLTLAFVLVLVFAASPQAMPRAAKPRTVESAITFFICLDSYLSQRLFSFI
jgi:hypothetical protein